ncbi:Hypothetical predicted protein [Mytilus galloprovincialis]|nr:Hypothetical predicted protein [Mytilus galloprovincialis]
MKDTFDTETITVSMPYIGEVDVDYSPSQVSIMKKKEKQAQMMMTKTTIRSIANFALKIEKKISACGDGVTGCTLLPHGKIAFANEQERNITVVKSDGSLDFKIDLFPYIPFDITYISKYQYHCCPSNASNNILKSLIELKKVLKTYDIDRPVAGISYSEKRLFYAPKKGNLECKLR